MPVKLVKPVKLVNYRIVQGQIVFYVVANEKIAHIAMMKSKEKGKSKKNRREAGTKKMFFAPTVSLFSCFVL